MFAVKSAKKQKIEIIEPVDSPKNSNIKKLFKNPSGATTTGTTMSDYTSDSDSSESSKSDSDSDFDVKPKQVII